MRLPRMTVRRWMIVVAVVGLLLAGGTHLPALHPFWYIFLSLLGITRSNGQRALNFVSPDGRRVVQVKFNDAGAARSGNHWTWLIVDHWLTGKRVIAERAEAYLMCGEGEVAFPSRWLDGQSLSVSFVAGRYDDHEKNAAVKLP